MLELFKTATGIGFLTHSLKQLDVYCKKVKSPDLTIRFCCKSKRKKNKMSDEFKLHSKK